MPWLARTFWPKILNPIFSLELNKSIGPKRPNQTYKTKSRISNLPSKMFEMLLTKHKEPKSFNKTYRTKSNKPILPNQF